MKIFLLLLCLCRLSLAEDTLRIAGTVVNGLTGQRLAGARVFLTPIGSGSKELIVLAKGDGRFDFLVGPGTYNLSAETPEIYRQKFGGHTGPVEIGVSIIAALEQKTDDLVLALFPPAVIQGKISDIHGDPVETGLIELVRRTAIQGKPAIVNYRWAYTDDRGEFRFGLLPPGTYYIQVNAEPWYSRSPALGLTGKPQAVDAFVPTYFPGTTDASAAVPLRLKSGDEVRSDLTLSTTRGVKLSVTCEGCQNSSDLELVGRGVGGAERVQQVVRLNGGNGTLNAVPPGHYRVSVRMQGAPGNSAAAAQVDVGDQDVAVRLRVTDTPSMSGIVSLEGAGNTFKGLLVNVRNMDTRRGSSGKVGADGSFSIPAVAPGSYQLTLSGPTGVYPKSIRLADKDIGVIEVPDSGTSNLRIVAGIGLAKVGGFAYRNGIKVSGVLVVLAPEGLTNEPDRYRSFQTDSDGSFNWPNIRPGSYRLFAVEQADFEYAVPDTIRPYLAGSKQLRVDPGDEFRERVDVIDLTKPLP